MMSYLELDGLRYDAGGKRIVDAPFLRVEAGGQVLLSGQSGSGKTSLLHLISGLLAPSHGRILFDGTDVSAWPSGARDAMRAKDMGFVFQGNHLIRHLSVFQNIALVCRDEARIGKLLGTLGLSGLAGRTASSLSYGEAQRVGIARAVAHKPKLILADEPTSALDDAHAQAVVALLQEQAEEAGAALIVSTHDARVKGAFARNIVMVDGKVLAQ